MTADLAQRITDYLASGGLFNPEMAGHDAVRDLLIECRDAFQAPAEGDQADPNALSDLGTLAEALMNNRPLNTEQRSQLWLLVDSKRQPKAAEGAHASDCAMHNMPAYPNGPCDCMPTSQMCRAAVEYVNGPEVYGKLPAEALAIEEGIYGEAWKAMQAAAPKPQPKGADEDQLGEARGMVRQWLHSGGAEFPLKNAIELLLSAASQAPAPAPGGWAASLRHVRDALTGSLLRASPEREPRLRAAIDEVDALLDAQAPAVTHAPLPLGWGFNHAQQAKDDEGAPIEGVWEVGWMDEDGVFSELLTIDADNYFQPEAAEPLARAILARLADSDVPVQHLENGNG